MGRYDITIRVTENGIPILERATGFTPSGRFEISGETDEFREKIAIDRRDIHGRFAISAQHEHHRAAHGDTPADRPAPNPTRGNSMFERGELNPETPSV